jgi:hypothetical protein
MSTNTFDTIFDTIKQQGMQFINNKKEKTAEVVKKEGYRGIMGSIPSVDAINNSDPDFAAKNTLKSQLSTKLTAYDTQYADLQMKTHNYLGMTAQYGEDKNYHVFVNKPMDYSKIQETPYENGKCISIGNNALAGLTDQTTKFNEIYDTETTYPFANNPAGAQKAIKACKLLAADLQNTTGTTSPEKSYFAVTKDANNHYKCYSGNTLNNIPQQYTVKKTAYMITSHDNVTRGGLFMDGTIGVYNHNDSGDAVNPYNIYTPFPPGQPSAVYSSCNNLYGGALMSDSISATLGLNCSDPTLKDIKPVSMQYITIKTSQTVRDSYLQIGKLEVWAIVDGIGKNVADTALGATATSGLDQVTNNFSWRPNVARPVDAILQNGSKPNNRFPNMYHSKTTDKREWWKLNLGKSYNVYKIVYYNRGDCCQWRSENMTIQFNSAASTSTFISVKDFKRGGVTTTDTLILNRGVVQTFMISS